MWKEKLESKIKELEELYAGHPKIIEKKLALWVRDSTISEVEDWIHDHLRAASYLPDRFSSTSMDKSGYEILTQFRRDFHNPEEAYRRCQEDIRVVLRNWIPSLIHRFPWLTVLAEYSEEKGCWLVSYNGPIEGEEDDFYNEVMRFTNVVSRVFGDKAPIFTDTLELSGGAESWNIDKIRKESI